MMDFAYPMQWIKIAWVVFALYWLVSAFNRKATKKRETYWQRLVYTLPLLIGFWFLFRPQTRDIAVLGARFVPVSAAAQWAGVALTVAGVGIAIWARWHLGTNWSGVVTLKQGHELIRTGPYRAIRHPIYTGILLGLLGTALTAGEVRGLVAAVLGWLSFYIKAQREESFLAQEFGPTFEEHRRQTGMFLPRLSRSADGPAR